MLLLVFPCLKLKDLHQQVNTHSPPQKRTSEFYTLSIKLVVSHAAVVTQHSLPTSDDPKNGCGETIKLEDTRLRAALRIKYVVTEFCPGIFLLDYSGTMWMNWCMVAICGMCIPLLLTFKEKYHRHELDTGAIQQERQRARTKPRQHKKDDSETKALLSSGEHDRSLRYASSGNSVV